MSTTFAEALAPVAKKIPQSVRDVDVLRVAALLSGDDFTSSATKARSAALIWAKKRAGGNLPKEAWDHQDFELLVGGRNSAAVRFKTEAADLWALRAEDPDKDVPGRIWTTEIVIGGETGKRPHLSLRLIVSTAEPDFSIEPHVPGTVLQMIEDPGLVRAGRIIRDTPAILQSQNDVEDLCDYLEDAERRLPVFVITMPYGNATTPYVNDIEIAKATAGFARVFRVPAELTSVLTSRFGKFRSVFSGAVRAYLPGFSASDDPYRHRLFVGTLLHDQDYARTCGLWLRRLAADHSLSSNRLGKDVLDYAIVRTASRRLRVDSLAAQNGPESELLEIAKELISSLETQLSDKDNEISDYVSEVDLAEDRAKAAEQKNRSLLGKIQRLEDAIARGGDTPTAEPPFPMQWSEFTDWLDQTFPDRVVLTPAARRMVRAPDFEDVGQVARAISWLATDQHFRRINGGGSTRDETIDDGVSNAYCGGDKYQTMWQGRRYEVDQHVKNGGNTHDPKRCLRIYYFWEPELRQTVIDHLPSHRTTSAS